MPLVWFLRVLPIDPETLEAMACREAISLGEEMHVQKLKISSDCLRVITELQADKNMGVHCMILKEIKARNLSFWHVICAMNGVHVIRRLITWPEWRVH